MIEVRSPGVHKGQAVTTLVDELDAGGFLFAGDDLGDLEASRRSRSSPMPACRPCSSARRRSEETALVELADVVVAGPDGVLALLAMLADDARQLRA